LLGLALALVIIQRGSGGFIPILGMGLLLITSLFFSETTAFPVGLLPSLGQILSFGLLAALLVNLGEGTAVKTLTHLGL
ncbi:MAG: hypothetical protein GWN58_07895, partial [Anaerolineae bacterium]|nr:hypothetical protein [Anaerolineae bacterium]